MKCFVRLLAYLGFLIISIPAQAGLITINGGVVSGPDRFENFDVGGPVTGVTTEFAGSGLNFTTLSGAGIQLTSTSLCGNALQGVSNGYLYQGLGAPCAGSSAVDSVSIMFDTAVSDLSWTGFNRAGNAGFDVEALLNGIVVSSLLFNISNRFENGTVLFSGSIFDEIRFAENGGNQLWFALDNMAWNTVPEPGTLTLLGIGLLGMGLAKRRKKI